jgi:hypothetical protein
MYYCLDKIRDTSPSPRVIPLSPPPNLGPHQGSKHDAGSPELEHHAQGVSPTETVSDKKVGGDERRRCSSRSARGTG